jgi:uncharacterized protein YjiS (DUF1127 family)
MDAENLNANHASSSAVHNVTARLARWLERAREREELARLDPLTQRDLGLSDADIWRETRRAPWQT